MFGLDGKSKHVFSTMLFKAPKVSNEFVFDENHRKLLGLKHFAKTVEVLKSVIALKSIYFKDVCINFTVNHFISDILKLIIETIDDDKTSLHRVIPLLI